MMDLDGLENLIRLNGRSLWSVMMGSVLRTFDSKSGASETTFYFVTGEFCLTDVYLVND